jgi:hypothetical protein
MRFKVFTVIKIVVWLVKVIGCMLVESAASLTGQVKMEAAGSYETVST